MLFASILKLDYKPLESALSVGFPLGKDCQLSLRCSSVCINIDDRRFLIGLIIMHMNQFDIILGMDWLSKYRVVIDCVC